jgi:hypothetical protein
VDGGRVRAADSPNRRSATKQRGPWREQIHKVSPVWDWRIRHVRDALSRHHCRCRRTTKWFLVNLIAAGFVDTGL